MQILGFPNAKRIAWRRQIRRALLKLVDVEDDTETAVKRHQQRLWPLWQQQGTQRTIAQQVFGADATDSDNEFVAETVLPLIEPKGTSSTGGGGASSSSSGGGVGTGVGNGGGSSSGGDSQRQQTQYVVLLCAI